MKICIYCFIETSNLVCHDYNTVDKNIFIKNADLKNLKHSLNHLISLPPYITGDENLNKDRLERMQNIIKEIEIKNG